MREQIFQICCFTKQLHNTKSGFKGRFFYLYIGFNFLKFIIIVGMQKLKPLSDDAIPQALEKAMRYRLLNDPWQAESICRDILNADPGNQEAVYILILSITDQFEGKHKKSAAQALETVSKLTNEYQSEYCRGLIYERQARAALKRRTPRAGYIAHEHLMRAMHHYENAEKVRPKGNEESILRWNACARYIKQHKLIPPPSEEKGSQPFLDV